MWVKHTLLWNSHIWKQERESWVWFLIEEGNICTELHDVLWFKNPGRDFSDEMCSSFIFISYNGYALFVCLHFLLDSLTPWSFPMLIHCPVPSPPPTEYKPSILPGAGEVEHQVLPCLWGVGNGGVGQRATCGLLSWALRLWEEGDSASLILFSSSIMKANNPFPPHKVVKDKNKTTLVIWGWK